jgi:hypothetical protein
MSRISEIVPVHDVEVALEVQLQDPRDSCRNAEIAWTAEGENLRIRVPKIDTYAAIVIESSA